MPKSSKYDREKMCREIADKVNAVLRVPEGRANTPEKKRAIIERIMRVWLRYPELRLCQLIENAHTVAQKRAGPLFYLEDEALAAEVEAMGSNIEKDKKE